MDDKDNMTTPPVTETEAAMSNYDDPDADLYEMEQPSNTAADDTAMVLSTVSSALAYVGSSPVHGAGSDDAPGQEPVAGAAYNAVPTAQIPQAQGPCGQQAGDGIGLDDFRMAVDLDIAMGVCRSKAHKIVECTEQYLKNFPVRLTDLMSQEGAKQAVSKILTEINGELWREYNTEAAIAEQPGATFKKKPPVMLEELPAYVAAAMLISTGDVKVLRTGTNSHVIVSRHY